MIETGEIALIGVGIIEMRIRKFQNWCDALGMDASRKEKKKEMQMLLEMDRTTGSERV